MRLLPCHAQDLRPDSLVLEEFEGLDIPPYAALSHVWVKDEVLLSHVHADTACSRTGYPKIKSAMQAAASHGLAYIWIDTCCIDKSSSVELSDAINSMFVWYENAAICFVHLAGLTFDSEGAITYSNLSKCRWFTRSWCLQKLVAPRVVLIFTCDWYAVGSKNTWMKIIAEITGIDVSLCLAILDLCMHRVFASCVQLLYFQKLYLLESKKAFHSNFWGGEISPCTDYAGYWRDPYPNKM